jgi:epoxyqueuosine reductase
VRPPTPPPDASAEALTRLRDDLVAIGSEAGLLAVGVASAEPLSDARRAIEHRVAEGLHGGMAFTFKDPARSTDPGAVVRGARSVVVGARSYLSDEPSADETPAGRVARYARVDHYAPLRAGLRRMADHLHAERWKAVVVADDNGMVDRAIAHRAGIGWFGKNANLLVPGYGSWVVLGSVVTDAPLPAAQAPVEDGCGPCRRCLDGCPTGAIVAPGVVDARRCLAWLVQAPGPFPPEFRTALGDRIYGCDDCQEVCPPNVRTGRDPSARTAAVGEAWVPLVALLHATDDELLARHGRWYLWDRDPAHLRRNALVALGNVADGQEPAVVQALTACLAHPHPLVRAHAVWAAARLARHDLLVTLHAETDPLVLHELHEAGGVIR